MAMAARPRALLTFLEGLTATVIDSQVLGHVRMMQDARIAEFEIWALPWESETRMQSLARLADAERRAGCRIRILPGIRPGRPGSVAANANTLLQTLKEDGAGFDLVHARTDYSVLMAAPLAAELQAPLIFDCRGDAAAELDYRADLWQGPRRLLKPLLHELLMHRLRRAALVCDRALFVSHPLHDLVAGEIGSKPHAVIPCCASEEEFFFDAGLRQKTRSLLGYGEQDVIYIYSGGLQPYQRFDDTIAAFGRLRARGLPVHLLLATPQADAARQRLGGLPAESWKVVSAKLEEVNSLLNAADAAFLLRHNDSTNRVASPTKFAEYCLAGLPVIMTGAILDSHRIAQQHGNLMPFNDTTLDIALPPQLDRATLALRYRDLLGKQAFFDTYRRIYAIG
jgi:glycosyltransferase involved in cell wall biosynthesis